MGNEQLNLFPDQQPRETAEVLDSASVAAAIAASVDTPEHRKTMHDIRHREAKREGLDPPVQDFVRTPTSDTATDDPDFLKRNEALMKIVETGGYLAQLGRRRQATRFAQRGGWQPPALREHQLEKGARASENFKDIREKYDKKLELACGNCALRETCSLGGNPIAFEQHFSDSGTRKKLERALTKAPDTQCDTVTKSRSRK